MHHRLLRLARDVPTPLIITILAGLTAGWLTIGQSYFLSSAITRVFLQGQSLSQVWPWMQALLAIALGRGLTVWLNEVAANRVAVRIKTDLRERLFAHILALGPAYTRSERSGELAAAAIDGIEALDAYFSQYLPQLVISTLVPISVLILVFPLDPLSGIVLLLTAPLIPFFMYMIGRGAEMVTRRQYETLSLLSAHFLDSLQGLTTLKLFGQAKAQARNIEVVSNQYRDTTLKVLQVTFLSAFALELLATLSTAIIAVEVGLRLLYAQMQFQEALFLLILAPEFYLPLRMLGLRFHAGMAGTSAARRIFEILDTPVMKAEGRKLTLANPDSSSGVGGVGLLPQVELRHVTYTYPGEVTPAVCDVTIKVHQGEHIALVGSSGAGKTTLVSLLLRFMEPAAGDILLNGSSLSQSPIAHWRSLTAWVPQSPHLFHGSIGANIRLGKPEASEVEVEAATRAAHLDAFIESLPERYETVIGEAGARLSSGQAQRLALARAFLKQAPILIMDEPTSSLDPETEMLLEESTRRLMKGPTVITIAHRLNTVARADQILVMKEGRIVEAGTHNELRQRNGVYARIANASLASDEHKIAQQDILPNADRGRILRTLQRSSADQAPVPSRLRVASAAEAEHDHYSVLLRLLSFLEGSWGWVALTVLLSTITIGASVALMGTSSWLISMAALHPSIAALEVSIVGVRFFGIARAVFRYLERLVSHNVTFRLLGRLRVWFYENIEPLAPARLMDYRSGDLLARIIEDVNTLENFFVRVVSPPLTAILACLGVSVFLAWNEPRLAVTLIASFLLLGILLPWVIQRQTHAAGNQAVLQRASLQTQLVDAIQGLPDLLAYCQGPERMNQLQITGSHYDTAQRQLAQANGVQAGIYTFVANAIPSLVLWIVIPLVATGYIPGVMLAPLVLIIAASFEAVSPLPQAAQAWSSARVAAKRLFEVVDAEPAVREVQLKTGEEFSRQTTATSVEFSEVSFAYPGQSSPVLNQVSFKLEQAQRLVIVGPSGAGKSTVASLLLRFWDFNCGEIRLNGQPIRELPAHTVREQVAFISPHTHLFNTSVFENLRMARRRVSREEVERAARAAQIHDVIVKLPKGYDTLIGEQGVRLSGGERQRLAIARAILKNAPLLILDEPTANLDAVTEVQILESLFEFTAGKPTLLITHRLVGLEKVDEILFLDRGRIVERGPQADLLRQDGFYRRFWDLQNRFLT